MEIWILSEFGESLFECFRPSSTAMTAVRVQPANRQKGCRGGRKREKKGWVGHNKTNKSNQNKIQQNRETFWIQQNSSISFYKLWMVKIWKKYVFVSSKNINLSTSLASNFINSYAGKGLYCLVQQAHHPPGRLPLLQPHGRSCTLKHMQHWRFSPAPVDPRPGKPSSGKAAAPQLCTLNMTEALNTGTKRQRDARNLTNWKSLQEVSISCILKHKLGDLHFTVNNAVCKVPVLKSKGCLHICKNL